MSDEQTTYFSTLYLRYADSLYHICLLYLKSREEAEEVVSETFVRVLEKQPSFENAAHEKAWLIKTAVNLRKNIYKSPWRRCVQSDDILQYLSAPEEISLIEELLALPPKYRVVLYLHYYQGYKTEEIADMMNMKQSTVLSRLSRGRNQLKEILIQGGTFYA